MPKLSGKIALVTGGTGALGSVIAEQLLQQNAVVIVTHTGSKASKQGLIALRSAYPNIIGIPLDVTDEASVTAAITGLSRQYGAVDILCNCVGGVSEKRFIEEIPLDEWNSMLTMNLQSSFLMMKHVLPGMKEHKKGRIINIAARTGIVAEPKRASYGVSKAALIALTRTAAEEVKPFGDITVNALAPSIIVTEANRTWGTEEAINQWVTPQQIAGMVVHLCSEHGAAVNGQIITMDGKV